MLTNLRYRLLNPSKEYEAFLSPTLGKFDFCIKASELQENGAGKKMIQSEIVDKLMDSVFATIPGSPAAVDLNENDGMAFVRKQLLSWLKVGEVFSVIIICIVHKQTKKRGACSGIDVKDSIDSNFVYS